MNRPLHYHWKIFVIARRINKANANSKSTIANRILSRVVYIVNGNLTEPIYESPAGPIAPIDIIYGHRRSLKAGRHYMAHKCGFTIKVLLGVLKNCGFNSGAGSTDGISIWVNAIKPEDKLKEIENRFRLHMGAEVD